MKIGLRILLGYFLIVGLAAWFLLNVFVEQVKPGVRLTLEDTLVDTANLLAVLVADDVKAGKFDDSAVLQKMRSFAQRSVDVKIGGVNKQTLDYRVYITNARLRAAAPAPRLAFSRALHTERTLSAHSVSILGYLIASAGCILLIGFYLSSVLHNWRRGFAFGCALTLLYSALYGLLISENNALVLGSLLLFAVLAAIMVATRKVDWYRIGRESEFEATR